MWIKAKDKDGQVTYINPVFVTRFVVEDKFVVAWSNDNLMVEYQKTPDLKEQLDKLLIQEKLSSPGFENLT